MSFLHVALFPYSEELFSMDWKSPLLSSVDELLLLQPGDSGLSRQSVPDLAEERGAWLAAGPFPDMGDISVFDDTGKELLLYESMHGPGLTAAAHRAFASFSAGDFRCGLSSGWDILFPEHARLHALSGTDILCVFASRETSDRFPLGEICRVRAAENQFYVALAAPDPCGGPFWGPEGPLPLLPAEERTGKRVLLSRTELRDSRKRLPLLALRRKREYSSLAFL